jgi:predicted deacylase
VVNLKLHEAFGEMEVTPFFKADYIASRGLFLQKSHRLDIINSDHQCWKLPPEIVATPDLNLAIDVVWLGAADAKKVLVLVSGTHGVEGFCGSAIQSFTLHALQQSWLVLPVDTAILLIHALNPWGMHWARRCDHQGIDINRNFIDFQHRPHLDPRYGDVLAALVDANATNRALTMRKLARQFGQRDFEQIFSGGQFEYHWAPFYGGQQPSFSSGVIDELITKWQLNTRHLTVIDLHTGLGKWAYGELISDHAAGDKGNDAAMTLFGNSVVVTALGHSCSVPKLGLLDYRWHRLMAKSGCFLTLEFGTLGTDSLFNTLIDEQLFWYKNPLPNADDPSYQKHREAMLAHFCPPDIQWRQAALLRSWQLLQQYVTSPK